MATVPGRQPPSGKMSPKRTPPRMRRSTRGPEGFLTPSDGATYTPESSRRIPDELLAKIVLAWTIVFFIVFFNTFRGARSVDADLIHSARFLGANERQIMTTVIVPSALAWTFASLTPSISFALIGVVVGEFLGGESGGGLGDLIIQSLGTLNAADMMVALLTLGVIGIVMALGIKQVEMRLLRWRPEHRTRPWRARRSPRWRPSSW